MQIIEKWIKNRKNYKNQKAKWRVTLLIFELKIKFYV